MLRGLGLESPGFGFGFKILALTTSLLRRLFRCSRHCSGITGRYQRVWPPCGEQRLVSTAWAV